MDHDTQQKLAYWNRKITNACWLILLSSMIIEFLMSFVTFTEFHIYVYNSVFVPTVYMLIIMISTEIAIRYFKQFTDYINITACLLLSAVLFWVHVSVPPIQGVLFLPFLFSIFYFRKSRVIFACIATIIMACFLYLNHDYFIDKNRLLFLFSAVAMLSSAYYIALVIMKRGMELLDDLKSTMNTQQELSLKNKLMERASRIDALTECYNHKSFHEKLDTFIERTESNQLLLHLAIIDIDNFKKVNDTYGHWAGDIVLKSVSRCIKELLTPNEFVARYGGEEFVVIFTEKTAKEAYQILDKIRMEIARTKHFELDNGSVTVSIGLESYVEGEGRENLFKRADHSLYTSKKTGKNKITWRIEANRRRTSFHPM
jgi:diguanylate cyclase (GGDEF)-like protein